MTIKLKASEKRSKLVPHITTQVIEENHPGLNYLLKLTPQHLSSPDVRDARLPLSQGDYDRFRGVTGTMNRYGGDIYLHGSTLQSFLFGGEDNVTSDIDLVCVTKNTSLNTHPFIMFLEKSVGKGANIVNNGYQVTSRNVGTIVPNHQGVLRRTYANLYVEKHSPSKHPSDNDVVRYMLRPLVGIEEMAKAITPRAFDLIFTTADNFNKNVLHKGAFGY